MSKIRIVLIEDHDLTRLGLRTTLERCDGIEVVGEAVDAIDGFTLLDAAQPDVAVVDIGLPGMDGIEFTQQIKESSVQAKGAEPKVLILTLQDSEAVVLAAFAAGATSYCMKDARLEHLLEALRVTAEGNSWIDPAIAQIVLQQTRQAQFQASSRATEAGTVAIHAADPEYSQVLQAFPLTERELEVLELIVAGYANGEISKKLYITVGTVKTHIHNILAKLSVDDRTQAAVQALRCGLIG